ncbi:MAG: hypothetical protein QM756_24655 [Polyangiaceae bacterium]
MARWVKLPGLLLVLVTALVVLIDTPLHRLTSGALVGGGDAVAPPELSWQRVWSGAFQQEFEAWFEQELAFRSALVRSENTLNLVLFHEISANFRDPGGAR